MCVPTIQLHHPRGFLTSCNRHPEFPTHKANYRNFLHTSTNFHEPIAPHDASMQMKVHHMYRLLFLKDIVLACILDDPMFNVLNSCIIFN